MNSETTERLDESERNPPQKGAGEGVTLPKGLSLFRFFLFGGLMLGALYGGCGLYFSSPPPPGYIVNGGVNSSDWEPSLAWFPVYLSIRSGVGIRTSTSGYVYKGRLGRAMFASSVIIFGIIFGGVLGWVVGEKIRLERLRRKALRVQAVLQRRETNESVER